MPAETHPIYSKDYQVINVAVGYKLEEDSVYYFVNGLPVFSHHRDDFASFRMITSQLIVNSVCANVEIQNAFGVTKSSVCRSVSKFKTGGSGSFYASVNRRKGPVMTNEILIKAQELLTDGYSRLDVAKELDIKKDTLSKAILVGKLSEFKKK